MSEIINGLVCVGERAQFLCWKEPFYFYTRAISNMLRSLVNQPDHSLSLITAVFFSHSEDKSDRIKIERRRKIKKYGLIGGWPAILYLFFGIIFHIHTGVAGVVGGTLIGLTGGLAAPFIAGGAGALIGSTAVATVSFLLIIPRPYSYFFLAQVFGSAAGAAVIGSLFGAAGAGLVGNKMSRRVASVTDYEFTYLSEGKSLHVAICISGWLEKANPGAKL